jgi:hypothetical protein
MTEANNIFRAILFAVAGYTLWVLSDALMKLAGESHLPPSTVIAIYGICEIIILVGYAWPRGAVRKLWPQHPRVQFMRALLPLCCAVSNVISLNHLPLTMFYITVFTAPMMIAILASVLLHEKLSLPKIIAIIAGFVGVVIAINPLGQHGGGDWIGYAAATFGTVCYAANTIWVRRMTDKQSVFSMVFINAVVFTLAGVGGMLATGGTIPKLYILAILFGMSLFSLVGNLFNYKALHMTHAATVGQFHYTQLIMGAILGFVIWNDVPGWPMIVGAAVIVGSGLYMANNLRPSLQ